jgi:hypothetical protein
MDGKLKQSRTAMNVNGEEETAENGVILVAHVQNFTADV